MDFPKGVYESKKKDGTVYYRSSLSYKGKHISLGSFLSPSEAHSTYQFATKLLKDTTISITSYNVQDCPLSFQKFISLINFRDHKLYFKNPIYLRNRYFEYYLSPTLVLKFDIDDLFYYSKHQIMKRGNHLFVADFGMQTSILFRYSIHPFSVKDIDYRFINGDCYDFRYSNIEVINPYLGVHKINRNHEVLYQARINIKGCFVIGYYATDIEAAIAYNKAADLLVDAGIIKEYRQNYLHELSNEDYESLYQKVTIRKNILNYIYKK